MDQFPLDNNAHAGSDRTRNILFVVLVLVAAFVTLTIVSFNRFARYVDDRGDVAYSASDETALEDDDETGVPVDDTVTTDPLVIPEYIGYGGVEAATEEETWLANEIDAWHDANPEWLCASLLPYADSNHIATGYGYPTGGILEEEDAQNALFNYLGVADEFRKTALRFELNTIEPSDMITGICKGPATGYFMTTLTSGGRIAVVYGMRVNENGSLVSDAYQPVGGIQDGYRFVPDLGNGEAFIATGYGDAGFVDWKYYKLNPELMTSELVESCGGGPSYDEVTGEEGEWTLGCALEYSPS